MEIQSLSVLLDIKTSIKKRFFRHVINLVEKKFQKDLFLVNSAHLMQILFKEIQAVHRLLEYVIIGKFDKSFEKIRKLFVIMNRNIEKCLHIFQYHMAKYMIYFNKNNINMNMPKKSVEEIQNNLEQFIRLVLNSCYYIHIFNLISGVKVPQYQLFSHQLKIILQQYIQKQPQKFKHQLAITRTYLLLMAINIKNSNYQLAKTQFYSAISHILITFRILQRKTKIKKKDYYNHRRNLLVLILIALINHQRANIQCDNLVGWETGFIILKVMQKQLKVYQGGWGKFIRNQYENNNLFLNKKMNIIKQIFVPFLTQQSQIFKYLLNPPQQPNYTPLITQCSKLRKKQHITHRKTYYQFKAETKAKTMDDNSTDQQYLITCKGIKSKNNIQIFNNSDSFNSNVQKPIRKYYNLQQSNIKKNSNNTCKKKFPSIDWFQFEKLNINQLQDTIIGDQSQKLKVYNFTERNQKQQKLIKISQRQHPKLLQNTLRKLTRKTNNFYNKKQLSCDTILQFGKQFIKQKRNQYAIHRLVSEQKQEKVSYSEQNKINCQKNKNKLKQIEQNETKSVEMSLVDVFIKMLAENKRKIGLNLLIDKYLLVKKKKKIRNYHHEMLEFQLKKNISNIIVNNKSDTTKIQKGKIVVLNNFISDNNRQQSKQNKQKILQDTHNKSKQIIKQMLKKIVPVCQINTKNRKPIKYLDKNISSNSIYYDLYR